MYLVCQSYYASDIGLIPITGGLTTAYVDIEHQDFFNFGSSNAEMPIFPSLKEAEESDELAAKKPRGNNQTPKNK
jgi:hypothetical protein